MRKRMMATLAIGTLLMAFVAAGCDPGVETPEDSGGTETPSCDPASPFADSANKTSPAYPSGLSCSGLFECYDQCAEDDSCCLAACWSQGSPAAQQAESAIRLCSQEANCEDWQCTEQACAPQLQSCFGDPNSGPATCTFPGMQPLDTGSDDAPLLSCSGLVECYEQCAQNDEACLETCWSQSSPAGQQAVSALRSCAHQASCQDWQCLEQMCPAEVQVCFD